MSMYLTAGVTILASRTEMQRVLSFQYTVGSPVCSARAYMYIWITLLLLESSYMHLTSPSVESEAIVGFICTFHQTATPITV